MAKSLGMVLPRVRKLPAKVVSAKSPLPAMQHSNPIPPRPSYKLPASNVLLYADRGLVVINKPNGLISQLSDPPHGEPNVDSEIYSSLMEDLRERLVLREPLRPLHRLDKSTTGVLAFATTKESARNFSQQISRGECQKAYYALACGDITRLPKLSGVIKTDIGCINGWVRIPGVTGVYEREAYRIPLRSKKGENWTKEAITEYEVLATSTRAPLSLLRLNLVTGIKHQLRVHLAQHLRLPILGDSLYLDPHSPTLKKIKHALPFPGSLFLHSSQMTLDRFSPKRSRITVGAPLPEKFVDICNAAEIPLDEDTEWGGVWVDGTKVRGAGVVSQADLRPKSIVEEEDVIQELFGNWYGPTRFSR